MIKYYTIDEKNFIIPINSVENSKIIRLVNPSQEELEKISKIANVEIDLLSAVCDKEERPRIENDEDNHLIILHIPYEDKTTDIPVITVAFGIIITKNFLITVCSVETNLWKNLLKRKIETIYKQSIFALMCLISIKIADFYLKYIKMIQKKADLVEKELHKSMTNEMLINMLNLEKSLVYFSTALKGNDLIWYKMQRIFHNKINEDESELIEDVLIEFKQAQDLTEIHSNILSGMMDAFASVISNNLNIVMKFLTSVTIILMIPTLITSAYGMNVDNLPFTNNPHAFWIVMGFSFFLSLISALIFWKKNLF